MNVYELKACFVEMLGDMNRRDQVENSLCVGGIYATLAAAQKALADDVKDEWAQMREDDESLPESKELKWDNLTPGEWEVYIEELELIYRITEVEVQA